MPNYKNAYIIFMVVPINSGILSEMVITRQYSFFDIFMMKSLTIETKKKKKKKMNKEKEKPNFNVGLKKKQMMMHWPYRQRREESNDLLKETMYENVERKKQMKVLNPMDTLVY